MQGVGCADVLLYFKCPTTKQMRCPVNAYVFSVPIDLPGLNAAKRTRGGRIVALRQIEVDDATGDLDVFDIFQEQAQDLNLPEALTRKPKRVTQGHVRVNRARRPDFSGNFF